LAGSAEVWLNGGMAAPASYDEIADWYEDVFLARQADADPLGVNRAIRDLLGPGRGPCLEIGCGTGVHARLLRELGWTPFGVDLSVGMLRRARGRLPIVRADARQLPLADRSLPVVLCVMAHTDMPGYPVVLGEAARVLMPGGIFVHIGVHPCFCGGFADHTDHDQIIIRPGYLDSSWTTASYTDQGIRDKVGATHRPLPELLHAFLAAGFTLERFTEGGAPTPTMLAIRARR
jgi:ubiquinone/menaquinone biosynthesis C-methylase UbiE